MARQNWKFKERDEYGNSYKNARGDILDVMTTYRFDKNSSVWCTPAGGKTITIARDVSMTRANKIGREYMKHHKECLPEQEWEEVFMEAIGW